MCNIVGEMIASLIACCFALGSHARERLGSPASPHFHPPSTTQKPKNVFAPQNDTGRSKEYNRQAVLSPIILPTIDETMMSNTMMIKCFSFLLSLSIWTVGMGASVAKLAELSAEELPSSYGHSPLDSSPAVTLVTTDSSVSTISVVVALFTVTVVAFTI